MQEHPELGRTLPGSNVLEVEIVNAVESEMAITLADAVFRRTDLATKAAPEDAALKRAAELMAKSSGWSLERTAAELAFVEGRLNHVLSGRTMLANELPTYSGFIV